MSETWNYQRAYTESDALVYSIKHDGFYHRLVFDAPSAVCAHQVQAQKPTDFKGRSVLWNRTFSLVPEAFLGSEPNGINMDTKVLLDEGIYLCYKGKNRQHLFQSIYLTARNWADKVDQLVFFWWYESTVYILVFEKQRMRFANIFNIKNASEAVYFMLAAAQECHIHQGPFKIVGDAGDSHFEQLEMELEKLQLTAQAVTRENLYSGYLQSPYQIISHYLFQLPQCALPEAY